MHITYIHLWGLTDLQVALEGNFLKFIPLQIPLKHKCFYLLER